MATVKDIVVGDYCTHVYTELSGMKTKLLNFIREIEAMRGPAKELLANQIPHFQYIIDTIDWKLEILSRVCPFEWEGPAGVEKRAAVQVPEVPAEGGEGYFGG